MNTNPKQKGGGGKRTDKETRETGKKKRFLSKLANSYTDKKRFRVTAVFMEKIT